MIRIASALLALYWLAIFVATHLPKPALPAIGWSDKVCHMLAFSGLSFLLAWALPSKSRIKHVLLVAFIAMTYASLDEFTQKFIPGRTCDIWDVAADGVGVCVGISAYTICRQLLSSFQLGRKLIHGLSR